MVHDYSWWTLFTILIAINFGLWLYCFVARKLFNADRPFSFMEAANITIGFVLCAILFKWGW